MPINVDAPAYHVGSVAQAPDSLYATDDVVVGRAVRHTYVKQQTKSAAYTMTAADSGTLTKIDTTAVITLPATVVGYTYTFENAGPDGGVQISVSPAAADKIVGGSKTGGDDKDWVNTLATARKGDRLTIVGDGANGWFVTEEIGTWAAES